MMDPDEPDNTMDLTAGDIIVIKYRLITQLLREDKADLI
jgi:hypothetical protein